MVVIVIVIVVVVAVRGFVSQSLYFAKGMNEWARRKLHLF